MNLKLITDLETILASEAQWSNVKSSHSMLRWDWIAIWLKHFESRATPAVIVATDTDGRWIGIAPFCLETSSSFTKKLRLVSSGTACGDYIGLIVDEANSTSFAEHVADFIVANIGSNKPLGPIDLIELEGTATADPTIHYFCELLKALGFSMHESSLESCWVVELPDTFETLQSQFSKSLRRKVKAAKKRLAADSTEILYANSNNFTSSWNSFVDLHQRRRATLGQPGCFACPEFEGFLKEATQRKLATDRASLIQINRDASPLAGVLLFEEDDAVRMYQSGFDPDRNSLEPGYQLIVVSIQHAIEKSKTQFDFLRGDEPYKARWCTEPQGLQKIRLVPGKLTARFKDSTWRIGKSLQSCVQGFLAQPHND
jgi:CelD/BcsL family acetyltransferase involved in cellulose biosynthesis